MPPRHILLSLVAVLLLSGGPAASQPAPASALTWSADPAKNAVVDPAISAQDGASARSYMGTVRGVMSGVAQALATRGQPNGLAPLDANGRLPLSAAPSGIAPLDSPTFTGTVTTPAINLSGAGSTGNISGTRVTSPAYTADRTLLDALNYRRNPNAPSGFLGPLSSDLEDEARYVDEFGPVDTDANTTATFQRAVAFYKARNGGRLRLRHRVYRLNALIWIDFSNFEMVGVGGWAFPFPNNPGVGYGSLLQWAGASGGTMLKAAPVAGTSAVQLSGVKITGIGLDGSSNLGGTGLLVQSLYDSRIDVNGQGWSVTVADVGAVNAVAPGAGSDTQKSIFRIGGFQVGAGNGLIARFDGDATHGTSGNFSKNQVYIYGSYKYSDGVHIKDSDTNTFEGYINRFGLAGGESGGRGLVLFGGNPYTVSGQTFYPFARANQIRGLWGEGGIYALGTESGVTIASGGAIGGGRKAFSTIEVDTGNGDVYPVIGTGAGLLVSTLVADKQFGTVRAIGGASGPPLLNADTNAALTAEAGSGVQVQFGAYNGDATYGFSPWISTKRSANDGVLFPLLLMPLGGNVMASLGHWTFGHLQFGAWHLWVDATGALRIKSGSPSSDTDGARVGQGAPLPASTVAALPTCNTSNRDLMWVATDVATATYRGAIAGGGSIRTPVYCDGASWTAH